MFNNYNVSVLKPRGVSYASCFVLATCQMQLLLWVGLKAVSIRAAPALSEDSDPQSRALHVLGVLFPLYSLGLSSSLVPSREPCTEPGPVPPSAQKHPRFFPKALAPHLPLITFMTLRPGLEVSHMSVPLPLGRGIGGLPPVTNTLLHNPTTVEGAFGKALLNSLTLTGLG